MNKITKIGITMMVVGAGLILAANISAKEPAQNDTILLTAKNTVTLNAEVDGESVGNVISDLKALPRSTEPAYLFLNTPGGEIQSGLEMIEAIKGTGRPVKTITLFAASMGFQIVQNLDERLIVKNGILMSHHARGQVGGEFGGAGESQLQKRYQFWKSRIDSLDQTTVNRTNGKQTLQSYQAAYENELWMDGPQAVEGGYADRVVTVQCDDSLSGATTHTANTVFGVVTYDLDKCPLNTNPKNIRMQIETTNGVMDTATFVKLGGQFGVACLMKQDTNKLCPLDTTITPVKIEQFKKQFVNDYIKNKNKIVYMEFKP